MLGKRIIAVLLLTVMLIVLYVPAHAHTGTQSLLLEGITRNGKHYLGREKCGWLIYEGCHTNGSLLQYKFDSAVPSATRNMVTAAAQFWAPTFSISVNNSYGTGTVCMASMSSDIPAKFDNAVTGSNGHINVSGGSWKLKINSNTNANVTKTAIAHEFGVALGLQNLISSANSDKLMYAEVGSHNLTSATTSDKLGARVITGLHDTHTWAYRYSSTTSTGNMHERYCTYCKGIRLGSIEQCEYNSNNICTKCGLPYGFEPNSVSPVSAALLPSFERQRREAMGLNT